MDERLKRTAVLVGDLCAFSSDDSAAEAIVAGLRSEKDALVAAAEELLRGQKEKANTVIEKARKISVLGAALAELQEGDDTIAHVEQALELELNKLRSWAYRERV